MLQTCIPSTPEAEEERLWVWGCPWTHLIHNKTLCWQREGRLKRSELGQELSNMVIFCAVGYFHLFYKPIELGVFYLWLKTFKLTDDNYSNHFVVFPMKNAVKINLAPSRGDSCSRCMQAPSPQLPSPCLRGVSWCLSNLCVQKDHRGSCMTRDSDWVGMGHRWAPEVPSVGTGTTAPSITLFDCLTLDIIPWRKQPQPIPGLHVHSETEAHLWWASEMRDVCWSHWTRS